MSYHFVKVCEYGHIHGQCRCMSKDKTVINVECTRPPDPAHKLTYKGKHSKGVDTMPEGD